VRSEVSEAGRLVAEIAAQFLGTRKPGAISASQPLLPEGPVDTEIAAAALRELVGLSGLFYESHQAEWVSGERDAEQLLTEHKALAGQSQERAAAKRYHRYRSTSSTKYYTYQGHQYAQNLKTGHRYMVK
jgi:hypothetical protein